MKLSKAEIRREIEQISSSYETCDIFGSPNMEDILQAIVTSACQSLNRIPVVSSFCDDTSEFTACTDGIRVNVNTLSPLIRPLATNWEKYVNLVGHMIHECGHVLFTDFVELNKLIEGWSDKKFTFYPCDPDVEGVDVNKVVEYLDTHPNYKKIFINEMATIQNIMEDVYIENQLYDYFDGVATLGLAKTSDEQYRQSPSEEIIYDKVLQNEISPLIAFSQILLIKRTGYPLKKAEKLTAQQEKVKDLIETYFDLCDEEIEQLKWEADGINRCKMLNRILVKIKPLLPEPPDNEDSEDIQQDTDDLIKSLLEQLSQQGGQECPNENDYSQQQADNQTSISNDMSKQMGASQMPQGNFKPVTSKNPDQQNAQGSKQDAQQRADSDTACQHKFEQAIKELARKDFEKKDEQRHCCELQEEAEQIMESCEQTRGKTDQFNGYRIDRVFVDNTHKQTYKRVFSEVSKTSNNLAKKLSNLLKDRELESSDSGYLMGQRFNAKDVVHNDGKYFSRISTPDGKPRVCFGILVDESGSMQGQKAESARRVTILLENTLRKINASFMICGHTTTGYDSVLIRNFVDFDTNDNQDHFRLADIKGRCNNIDGAAITYVGEKLIKRPEEQKIMIVISDGQPCGGSFYSDNDDEDTALAAQYYRKKGIKVFGAVVDSWELVSRLYGEQYSFDCREDKELERQLIRLIRRYIK